MKPQNVSYLRPEQDAKREAYRLSASARIAAGMCANPNVYEGRDWLGEVARNAYALAGKLMQLSETGGC